MAGELVLLTGATGFIASHILGILLERGYSVIGTVRSLANAQWLSDLYSAHEQNFKLVVVEDVSKDGAFDKVLQDNKEIKFVLHTASPFFHPSDDVEGQLLKPAIKGTTEILSATKAYGSQVEHVVVTSSFAAIVQPSRLNDPSITYTEKTWNPYTYEDALKNPPIAYTASKKLAEQALWTFLDKNDVKFTATTINPPLVLGPVLQQFSSPEKLNTSSAIVYKILKTAPGESIDNSFKLLGVDVRDVALAHVLALEKKVSAGKRWFICAGYLTPFSLANIVKHHFPGLKIGDIPSDYSPEKEASELSKFDNRETNAQTGMKYRSLEDTVVDTVNSLRELERNW